MSCMSDEVAEWLRRWTANPMCSARVGSNPILVEFWSIFFSLPVVLFSYASFSNIDKNMSFLSSAIQLYFGAFCFNIL